MPPETLNSRLKRHFERLRGEHWPRLREDIARGDPKQMFLTALLSGLLISVPVQISRLLPDNDSAATVAESTQASGALNSPTAQGAITRMPKPGTPRPIAPVQAPPPPAEPGAEQTQAGLNPGQADGNTPASEQEPRVLERTPLDYPRSALRNRQSGTVVLEVSLSASGEVTDVEVVQSSGHRSLDRAARKDVKRWTFAPKIQAGAAVDSRLRVPVDYTLAD